MAPMTRNRADENGEANAEMAAYYRQRASAGLVITESAPVSPAARHERAAIVRDLSGDQKRALTPRWWRNCSARSGDAVSDRTPLRTLNSVEAR